MYHVSVKIISKALRIQAFALVVDHLNGPVRINLPLVRMLSILDKTMILF